MGNIFVSKHRTHTDILFTLDFSNTIQTSFRALKKISKNLNTHDWFRQRGHVLETIKELILPSFDQNQENAITLAPKCQPSIHLAMQMVVSTVVRWTLC